MGVGNNGVGGSGSWGGRHTRGLGGGAWMWGGTGRGGERSAIGARVGLNGSLGG